MSRTVGGGIATAAAALVAVAIVQFSPQTRRSAETPDRSAEVDHWWEHVSVLASDSLAGRAAGTADYERAAHYVANAFRAEGLVPGAPDGYLDPVGLTSRRIDEASSSITLTAGAGRTPLVLGNDAFFQLGAPAPDQLEAPLFFIGYGLHAPEAGHDDLQGLDLRGKVAVFIQGGPKVLVEPFRSHLQSTAVRWEAIRRTGALGWISIPNPRFLDLPFERIARQRLAPAMSLSDSTLDDRYGQKISILFNPASASLLFERAPYRFEDLLVLADSGGALPRFPLAVGMRAAARYESKRAVASNVVAILPGTDRKLRQEAVVVSAHLDHLGIVAPVQGDSICNGALDNAAGVASLLEVARMARESGWHGRRTVVFLACTAEEKGLLGSRSFAFRPPQKVPRIVANLNVDMFLPLIPLRRMIVFGDNESDLGPLVRGVAARRGVEVQPDPEPLKNRFIRSDQYNFIRRGEPSVAFKCGYELGTAEETLMTAWLHERYHAPSDDLAQPVDRACAQKFSQILFEVTKAVADRPEAPRWNRESFFRRLIARSVSTSATSSDGRAFAIPPHPELER